jgi:hypothetical protein
MKPQLTQYDYEGQDHLIKGIRFRAITRVIRLLFNKMYGGRKGGKEKGGKEKKGSRRTDKMMWEEIDISSFL